MNKLLCFTIILLGFGCKEKFVSPAPAVVSGYLVVEGVINNGGGTTNIKLSRTTSLNDNSKIDETGALVTLVNSNNASLLLSENSNGNYTVNNLHLDTTLKYQLSIKTSNSDQYLSDFVKITNNPPIDSINWVYNNDVQLFINTHDPKNNTLYYQWDFAETWEFHSAYGTTLKYVTKRAPNNDFTISAVPRDAGDPEIYTCWQFGNSSSLLLGSSAKLNQDIIHLPLTNIEHASWKLSVLYSILVNQYAWSKEGYEFLERMKKNTESVGSVFDAQPSELNGNIHSISHPNQPVIGFFNICTVQQKRIFINNNNLARWGYNAGCTDKSLDNISDSIKINGAGTLPTNVKTYGPFGSIVVFYASTASCVDCSLSGTNVKPIYWP